MSEEKNKTEYNNCTFNYNYTTSLIPTTLVAQQKQMTTDPSQDLLDFIKEKIDIKLSDDIITDILNAEDEYYARES